MKIPERDHVDRVRDQWAQEWPELDTSPVAVVARVGRLAELLDDRLNEVFADYGLRRDSWDVLASLRRSGKPYRLSPTNLYQSLMRTSGAMTNRLRRLEESQLIRRVPNTADARGLLVELTPKGRRTVDTVVRRHLDNERQLLAPLSLQDQAALASLLRALLLSLETT